MKEVLEREHCEEKEDQVILECLKGEKSSHLFLLETTNKKEGSAMLLALFYVIHFLGNAQFKVSMLRSFKIFTY